MDMKNELEGVGEAIEEKIKTSSELIAERLQKASVALDKKPLVDRVVSKAISRKFLTFAVATALMLYSNLDSETWGMIAMIYIGSQSVVDAALAWKHGPNG